MLIRYLMALLLSLVLSPAWGAVPPTAPDVATSAASGLLTTGATLNGIVSSNGASTTVSFDYGPDTGPVPSYGSTVTAGSLVASATNTLVSAVATALTCGTLYHYRVNGANSAGTTNGSDATFVTSACVPTLGITASTSAAPINNYVSFNITATNDNGTDLSSVKLTDVLPAGMTYKSSATTVGTVEVDPVAQTIKWTIASLPAGESVSLILVVQLTQKGTIKNIVRSSGAEEKSATILVLPSAVTHYRMDELGTWKGAANDVWDSGGNKLNGHRRTTSNSTATNAVSPSPTIASQNSSVVGEFCNAGYFDGNAVVETASSPFFGFQQTLSASAWIYPTALPSKNNIYSILSNDVNYEFHLDSSGHLYWWWQDATTPIPHTEYTLTSAKPIPLNQWTHIAITMDASIGQELIYINGVADANTNNWKGTLVQNLCPMYIGGDIGTSNPPGKSCDLLPQRNFRGNIDEAKIYNYALSAAEVNADMTLGRLCNGTFDHIEIDHDGSASVCTPKTVTLKACLDVNCTALYTDKVSVKLSPGGWFPDDTVKFDGGVTTATLNNSSLIPPGITLGAVSADAINKTRCFNVANGRQETCTLNVPVPPPTLNCFFDAVETSILPNPPNPPRANIYTKLVGTDFKVDLLALLKNDKSKVDKDYTGTVTTYDLIDSAASCSSSSKPLNTTSYPSFTYTSADKGRKTVTMNCPTPSSSVKVRIQIGPTYACSTDEFTVRPLSVTLTSTDAQASSPTPLPTDMPVIKAGTLFNIGATTTPGDGYKGVLMLDSSKLTAQSDGTGTTLGTLWLGPFTLGTTKYGSDKNNPAVQANMPPVKNAAYSEVGYLYANAGAFVDKIYTIVDQTHGSCANTTPESCDCLLATTSTNNNGVPDYLSNTLINGRYGCFFGNTVSSPNKTSFAFGRFIPDHFDTVAIPTQNCVSFYYSGQPITLQVTAKNGAGGTTLNYDTTLGFSKGVTLTSDATGNLLGSFSPSSIQANIFAQGATFPVQSPPAPQPFASAFSFKTPTKPTTIYLRAVEVNGDGVSSDRGATPNTNEGSAYIYSGRLRLIAGQGSELAPFWMQTEVQSYDGKYWSTSIADSCTTYDANNFAVADSVPPTGTTVSTVVGDVKPIRNGFGSILLTRPNVRGTATICLNMATTPKDDCKDATSAADLGYLRGNWRGATTFTKDPSATVQFGGANSNSRGNWGYLYRRENF